MGEEVTEVCYDERGEKRQLLYLLTKSPARLVRSTESFKDRNVYVEDKGHV